MAAKYFALCKKIKAFPNQFAFENVGNRAKTDLANIDIVECKGFE